MGDSRFNLKAEFSIYGQTYKCDWSLNWSAEDGEIDRRITEWFLTCYDTAWRKRQDVIYEQDSERCATQEKERELRELRRLKEKYQDAQ